MQSVAIQLSDEPEKLKKCWKIINKNEDIVRQKTENDPQARGAKHIQGPLRKALYGTEKI